MANRLSIVKRDDLLENERRFYDAVAAIRRRSITGPFITLLNSSPDLAARFAHLGHYYHARGQGDESILSLRVRGLIGLIGARALDGPYEWAAWVNWTLEAGLPQATADAIRERKTPSDLTPEDALVLDFCTQLLTGRQRVSDATFAAAIARFGVQGVVELVNTLGYFAMIAFPLNAFEIEMSAEQKSMRKAFVPLEVGGQIYEPSASAHATGPVSGKPDASRDPRIPLVTKHSGLAPEHHHFFDRIILSRGRVAGPFPVLLHSPDVAARVAHIGAFLLYDTVLEPRVKTFVWLLTAREFDCDYEWAYASAAAKRAGLEERLIGAFRKGETPSAPTREQEQELLIGFCHQLLRGNHHVSEATYRATVGHFGVPATVQIAATIGYFAMQAFTLNAFEVAPPSDESDFSL